MKVCTGLRTVADSYVQLSINISCVELLKTVTAQIMFTGAFVESFFYITLFAMISICTVILLDYYYISR